MKVSNLLASVFQFCYAAVMASITLNQGQFKGYKDKTAVFIIEYVKDFACKRASEAAGLSYEAGLKVLKAADVQTAISQIVNARLDDANIDALWLLKELADNHFIARQMGNINASNAALKLIAQLAMVDALAKQKVELDVVSDKELTDRIKRGRERTLTSVLPDLIKSTEDDPQDKEVSFL